MYHKRVYNFTDDMGLYGQTNLVHSTRTLKFVPVRASSNGMIYSEPFIGNIILPTHKIISQIDYD